MSDANDSAGSENLVTDKPPGDYFIAGVGASAGGLEALTELFSSLPTDLNCSFVVLQHLSPNYKSMLVELIGRQTNMDVLPAEDGIQPLPGRVYVAPPKWDLIMAGTRLRLVEPLPDVAPKPSVNRFLSSLSDGLAEYALGVILSGTGSDGSSGIRTIKANGGVTFAQEPNSAKYAGMPRAAIETVSVDFVRRPSAIADEIAHYVQRAPHILEPKPLETDSERYKRLLKGVYEHTKVDFSGYKDTTIWRRIQRRMATTGCDELDAYLEYSKDNPIEYDMLCKDILISVTGFFRDKAAFNSLKFRLREICERKSRGDEIRIWVAGCATGEEAYSIAILLLDLLGERRLDFRVQIFATDIDQEALGLARRGFYSHAALEDAPVHYLNNYFAPNGDQLEICQEAREMVVFARQDVVLDPPFLRLDLVSCRNLLIYFTQELQAKVLSVMRYALVDSGYLFLGRSENVSQAGNLFRDVDARNRIFVASQKTPDRTLGGAVRARLDIFADQPARKPRLSHAALFQKLATESYVPPSILIDSHFTILHTSGDVSSYVQFPDGVPQLDLTVMLGKELRSELLSLVHYARSKEKRATGYPRRLKPGPAGLVRVVVHPYRPRGKDERFLVSFEIVTRRRSGKKKGGKDAGPERAELEHELTATQEHLQTVIEELETSNEEMQALNEEIQAANEELQASNEELEASNEELQSSNEELVTLNTELLTKSAALSKLNLEFEKVQNSIDFPLLVVDVDQVLTRFNRAAYEVLKLTGASLAKPVGKLRLPSPFDGLGPLVDKTIDTGVPLIRPLVAEDRYYLLHMAPYRDESGSVGGAVITLVDQTDVREAERQASQNEERLLSLMNSAPSLICVKDNAGRYQMVNQRFLEMFDFEQDAVLGKTDEQLFGGATGRQFRDHDLLVMQRYDTVETDESVDVGGEMLALHSVRFPIKAEDGAVVSVCSQMMDVTSQYQAREQLRLAASVFEHSGEGILITDSNVNIVSVNRSFTTIMGFEERDVVGRNPSIFSSGRHEKSFFANMWRKLSDTGHWQGEIWNRRKDGEMVPEWLTINSVFDDNKRLTHYVGTISDISVMKEKELRIEHMATHDELTGLPNRSLFTDRLRHALAKANRQSVEVYVLFIDLDNFKVINDNMGHEVGDELLKKAAKRVEECLREEDTVARWGGDEFVVSLEDIDSEQVTSVANRIIDYLAASFELQGKRIFVSASIGISCYPLDGQDVDALLRGADTAMYKSKDTGKNQFQFYSNDMKLIVERRLTLETGLRLALEKDEFRLVFQPEVNIETGECVALEALLRWKNDELGVVPPASFIPVAEQGGLITNITEWVIRHALETLKKIQDTGTHPPRVFVNVSAKQLQAEMFLPYLETQCEVYGIDPLLIGIEITESVLMLESEQLTRNLESLRRFGTKIYIDDFGTGYSSLSYLKRYPVDGLKIDRNYVDGIASEADDQAIATAVIGVADALGMLVLAEGIETTEQQQALVERGCRYGQGFLFSQPLSETELIDYLHTV